LYVQHCVTSCNSLHNSSTPYHTISSNQQQLEKKPGGHSSKCGAKWKNYAWSCKQHPTKHMSHALPCSRHKFGRCRRFCTRWKRLMLLLDCRFLVLCKIWSDSHSLKAGDPSKFNIDPFKRRDFSVQASLHQEHIDAFKRRVGVDFNVQGSCHWEYLRWWIWIFKDHICLNHPWSTQHAQKTDSTQTIDM